MSLYDLIAEQLPNGAGPNLSISARRYLVNQQVTAAAASTLYAPAASNTLLDAIPRNGALYLESWNGRVFGQALAGANFTLVGMSAGILNATPAIIYFIGQPEFTIINIDGSATVGGSTQFTVPFQVPLIHYQDLANMATIQGLVFTNPPSIAVSVEVLNGATAQNISIEQFVQYRIVQGIESV
jgi:hypothetical protein